MLPSADKKEQSKLCSVARQPVWADGGRTHWQKGSRAQKRYLMLSSVLPLQLRENVYAYGMQVENEARCFALNTDLMELFDLLFH